MNFKTSSLTRQLVACSVLACFAGAPAFAGTTDISNVPLPSGTPLPPNVLFTLDNSGSMDWDFLPDYVDPKSTAEAGGTVSPNAPCMSDNTGSTINNCYRGDPPHEAGGQNGSNGVSYDPKLRYLPGQTSTGAVKLNGPSGNFSPFTSVPNDAYGTTPGNANLTTGAGVIGAITNGTSKAGAFDKRYCNSAGTPACKRNGAADSAAATITPSGTLDPEGNPLGAGQFPYRANVSSSSVRNFGLPEMMTTASFTRGATSTVTATTPGKPSLAVNDRVWVSASAALNVTCATVTAVSTNSFTYTSGASGASGPTNGVYRKCSRGSWTRVASGTTITVTPADPNDQLQTNDLVLLDSSDDAQDKLGGAVAVTVSGATFTYAGVNTDVAGTKTTPPVVGAINGTVNWVRTSLYNVSTAIAGSISPTAYTITPVEHCSDVNLTICQEVIPPASPPGSLNAAYVRFCQTQADAIAPGAVSGNNAAGTPRCQAKYTNTTGLTKYQFARYGYFNRETIASGIGNFANRPARTDCTAVGTPGVCNYTEEMENFSRWYTYYRTRMQMMKTAAGRAFQSFVSNPAGTPPRPDTLRVGFITINSPTSNYLKINNFNAAQATSWYSVLYGANPGGGTPLREALARAGWIFAGKMNTGLTSGIANADDPVQASCQRNFSILTTDGFWNGNAGKDLANANIGNVDGTQSAAGVDQLVSQEDGTWDGGTGASGTLADVAQYYYQTDLRDASLGTQMNHAATAVDVSNNNVPAKSGNKDFLTTQHMVTFTLGLADGLMRYQSDYETAGSGDFFNIKNGTPGACFWVVPTAAVPNPPCAWPVPVADNPSALDDLWHAAVNGRGTYYQALNANALAQSLSSALGNLNAQNAAAAASATSSPNITQTDNQIFSTTYQTNTWAGKIFAQTIDPVTGNVNPTIQWQADDQMLLLVGSSSDSRNILTPNPTSGGLMQFTYANILANKSAANEQDFFQNRCTGASPALSQCGSMAGPLKALADTGDNMVNFLRGRSANESSPGCGAGLTNCLYRDRQEVDPITNAVTQTVIGDTISAKPNFVRGATFDYGGTYDAFKLSMASRPSRLYVGANDGYLHAFDGGTGNEIWAYAPHFILPGMWQLADTAYSANHRFFLDGSPESGDVFDGSQWRTILVGGAGAGGRGFYALDITSASSPIALWEFCADATLCSAHHDPDVGLSYSNPIIGKRPDGTWVVVLSSGLNNVGNAGSTGGGYFFVLNALTGQVLHKVPTATATVPNPGTTTTPSGLMKLSAYYDNPLNDATFRYVYGGDQLGNIWRMDMPLDASQPTVQHIATLTDGTTPTRAQPITTRMSLTHIGANRVIYVGTGRYLGSTDLTDPGAASGIAWQQSIYAIKDKVVDAATDYGNIRNDATFVVQTLTNASSTTRTTSTLAVNWNTNNGWRIDLNPGNTTPGERVSVDPELIIGTLVIASNIPTTSAACTVGGESFLYQFDFKTGQYVANALNHVAGQLLGGITVGQAIVQLPSGAIKDIVTTADTSKTSQGVNVGAATAYLRRFSYRER